MGGVAVRWTVRGLAVIAGALAIGLVLKSCQRPDDSGKIPEKLERKLDSLAVTAPAHQDRQDSIVRVIVVDTLEARRLASAATAAKRDAEASRQRADDLARQASAGRDSAILWRQAYDARTEEAAGLRTSLAQTDSALAAERSARAAALAGWHSETSRRMALEDANQGLRVAITRLEKPCRIVGPIPCPNRTVAFVGGVTLGVVALSSSRK